MAKYYQEIRNIALINAHDTIINNIQRFRKAYKYIIDLSTYAQEEGILFLDSHMDFADDDDPMTENLIWMINMIDSFDPDCIEEIVTNRFIVRDYKGIEAFIYYVYAIGVMYIQRGVSSIVIEAFFNSFIPKELIPEDSIIHTYFDLVQKRSMQDNLKKIVSVRELLTDEEKENLCKIKSSLMALTNDEWKFITSEDGFKGWDMIIPILDTATKIMIDAHMNPGRVRRYMWGVHMPKEGKIRNCCEKYFEILDEIRKEIAKKVNLDKVILEILEMDRADIEIAIKEEYYSNTKNYVAIALKGVTESVVERLLDTVDKRTAMYLRDEIEIMGPVKTEDIVNAQKLFKADVVGIGIERNMNSQSF